MRSILSFIGLIGLILTIVPSVLFITDVITIEQVKWSMGLGMVLWFVTACINQFTARNSGQE